MLLWTVMPIELVLEGIEKQPQYEEFQVENKRLVVEKVDNSYRVVRIISTCPEDYLDQDYTPGRLVNL